MKFRVLFIAIALVAMTSLSFGATPAQVMYYYPGDWDHSSHDPITTGIDSCFDVGGTAIPLGSVDVLYPFVEGVEYGPYDFNDWGGLAGYFTMDYYAAGGVAVEGDVTYLEVRYEGCTYRTREFILGPGAVDIGLVEADFDTCFCEEEEYDDLGDLGAPYPTAPHPAGPCHALSGIAWLGAAIDAEAVPNVVDLDLFDDGVVFITPFPWIVCTTVSIDVTVSGPFTAPVYLSGWKDGNLDGDFDDAFCFNGSAPEWFIQDVPIPVAGVYRFDFKDPGEQPAGHPVGVPWEGVFRFRLSHAPMGAQWWMGGHDELGEVEDYYTEDGQLPVELTAEPILQIGDRQLTLSFDVADELDVQHYDIMRDGAKVVELEVADGSYTYVDQNLVNSRRYEYSIIAVGLDEMVELEFDGNSVWAGTPSFKAAVVTEYALHQNYPNPFNPTTEIVYDVLNLTHVTLKVYNVMGQEVATLVNHQNMNTGRYVVTFDASGLTSGIYFYTVSMGDFSATKKMLLVQ